jgi:hypothetical protein
LLPFDKAQGPPFDKAQGPPFDKAQGPPFDKAQGNKQGVSGVCDLMIFFNVVLPGLGLDVPFIYLLLFSSALLIFILFKIIWALRTQKLQKIDRYKQKARKKILYKFILLPLSLALILGAPLVLGTDHQGLLAVLAVGTVCFVYSLVGWIESAWAQRRLQKLTPKS